MTVENGLNSKLYIHSTGGCRWACLGELVISLPGYVSMSRIATASKRIYLPEEERNC